MSSFIPRSNQDRYEHGGYSVLPVNERKATVLLDTVLNEWDDKDEIKYKKPSDSKQTGYYYSDSQQPEGFLENGRRFFARLADPDTRTLHSQSIDQVVKDLKATQEHMRHASQVEKDSKIRKMLGQPIFVGALRASLNQAKTISSAQKKPCSPSPGLNFFGKRGKHGEPEEKPSSLLVRSLSMPKKIFGKNGYQPIGGDDSTKPRTLSHSTLSYQTTYLGEASDQPLFTNKDFPPPIDAQQQQTTPQPPRSDRPTSQDGTPQHVTSGALDRFIKRRQEEQKKTSDYGSISSAPRGSTTKRPPGNSRMRFIGPPR